MRSTDEQTDTFDQLSPKTQQQTQPKADVWQKTGTPHIERNQDGKLRTNLPDRSQAMMQCKDIPDEPILRFLHRGYEGGQVTKHAGAGWHNLRPRANYCPTVRDAMPDGIPDKLVLAKMKMMVRRGVVQGCACGCRGDFTITWKGLQEIGIEPRGPLRETPEQTSRRVEFNALMKTNTGIFSVAPGIDYASVVKRFVLDGVHPAPVGFVVQKPLAVAKLGCSPPRSLKTTASPVWSSTTCGASPFEVTSFKINDLGGDMGEGS